MSTFKNPITTAIKKAINISPILLSSIIITGCFDTTPEDIDPVKKTKEIASKYNDKIPEDIKEDVVQYSTNKYNKYNNTAQEEFSNKKTGSSNFESISLYDVYVVDGDTVHGYDTNHTKIKVRMLGSDAPESSQPMGKDSKASLETCISSSPNITLSFDSSNKTDRYGRYLAIVNSGVTDCNLYQISNGMAYYYRDYSDGLPNEKKPQFDSAEYNAKQQRIGVWSQDLQRPWDYRKSKRN